MHDPVNPTARTPARALLLFTSLALAGCIELDIHIKVHPDERVTITERVRLTDAVLDLASTLPAKEGLEVLLKKDRALERLKLMGEGCTLVSHAVNDLPGGGKECVAVYTIPDLNRLHLCTPAIAVVGHEENRLSFRFYPEYFPRYNHRLGTMVTRLSTPSGNRKSIYDGAYLQPRPKPISPAEAQDYRDLIPILADLMKDFELRMRIEYWPVDAHGGTSDTAWYKPTWWLIRFDEKRNLDNYGAKILENEEFLLALMRWDLQSPHILDVLRHAGQNASVPIWSPKSGTGGYGWHGQYNVRPTAGMRKRHWHGKPKWMGGDVQTPRPKKVTDDYLRKWGIIKDAPKKK